jgi:hypothetical protein
MAVAFLWLSSFSWDCLVFHANRFLEGVSSSAPCYPGYCQNLQRHTCRLLLWSAWHFVTSPQENLVCMCSAFTSAALLIKLALSSQQPPPLKITSPSHPYVSFHWRYFIVVVGSSAREGLARKILTAIVNQSLLLEKTLFFQISHSSMHPSKILPSYPQEFSCSHQLLYSSELSD